MNYNETVLGTESVMGLLWVALSTVAWGAPQTDIVGQTSGSNDGNESFKLNAFTVDSSVELDAFEVYLEPMQPGAEVVFALYEESPAGGVAWALIWDSGEQTTTGGEGFKSSGTIGRTLESGRSYAVGVYLIDDFRYWWESNGNGPQNLGWGTFESTFYAWNGSWPWGLPQNLGPGDGDESLNFYHQRITVNIPDDNDGDGFNELEDCDDADPTISPGAAEACDEIDNDCDGEVDEDVVYRDVFVDADGDGFGDDDTVDQSCEPSGEGFSDQGGDCDDDAVDIFPGAPEICDGQDSDCDGEMGPAEEDGDGDGVAACGDCDDEDVTVYPGAPELCGTVDKDCDGEPPTDDACDEALLPASACACSQVHPSGTFWLLAPVWIGLYRRRR
jgi:hypothetical protein